MQEDEGKPRPVAYDGREAHDAELIYPLFIRRTEEAAHKGKAQNRRSNTMALLLH
jgi:hypothetical protein